MSNTFVTPKAVSTIAQSRIDYNTSLTSVLQNFASTGSPSAGSINLEGTTGLRTGMLWYKSGSNTADGQGRLFVYSGSEFTRNGISTYKMPSVALANAAVQAGKISYGELVTVGTDTLYIVNSSNTGVIRLTAGTADNSNLLDGLDSSQFLRSDVSDSTNGKLTISNSLSVLENVGIGISTAASALHIEKDEVIVKLNDTNGSLSGNMNAFLDFIASGTTHGHIGFANTTAGVLSVLNRQGNVVISSDSRGVRLNSGIEFEVDGSTKAVITGTGRLGVNTNSPIEALQVAGSANVTGGISAASFTGVGTNVTNVNASQLNGQGGTYYLTWANTIDKPDPLITVTLTGDVTGSGSATLTDITSNTISFSTTIAANSVALGTDTTGSYVSTITGTSNQVIVSGSGSETAEVILSLPQNIHTEASPSFAGVTLDAIRIGVNASNQIDTSSGNLILDSAGGTVTIDDNLSVTGDADAANFNSTSDLALKKDLVQISDALEKVKTINGYTFTYKNTEQRSAGVIAQEIEKVLPEAVRGEPGSKTVAYGNLIALLIEAIKEQQQRIERLENGR